MNKCKKCSVEINAHRVHLGYSECVECSEVKRYVSHTIYPHKTGAWVQPVSEEQSKNLNRLDRRSVGSGKAAKGIIKDNSWDRWLDQYLHNKSNPKPKPKKRKVIINNTYIPYKSALTEVMSQFDSYGYDSACELTQSLYTQDKINLQHKSNIMDQLVNVQMMTSKERKFFKKLQKSA